MPPKKRASKEAAAPPVAANKPVTANVSSEEAKARTDAAAEADRKAALELYPEKDETIDALGRKVEKPASVKERVEGFKTFSSHMGNQQNAVVGRVFVLFSLAIFLVPLLVYVVMYNAVVPTFGETTFSPPLMEDDDGNLIADPDFDVTTAGRAHTVVTLMGWDRSVVSGLAAVTSVLVLQVLYVGAAFAVDAAHDARKVA